MLTKLWSSRVSVVLGNVRAGEAEHRELANMAAQVSADYHGRFLVELLQNASDQAAAAELRDSCVTIIRTDGLVAFANEGVPFDEKGVRSITSLGLSTKNPEEAIGNKGIGFKSVFQISEAPEIFSSSSPLESFADGRGLMFKLSLTPFANTRVEHAVRTMVSDQLAAMEPADATLTVNRAMEEIKAAAPFKFPIPLSPTDLNDRLADLPALPRGQTMVVLPLRQTAEATTATECAIDELFEEAGAAILFLPSVSTIVVIDQVRGFTRTISRRCLSSERLIDGFGRLSTVVTGVHESEMVDERSWRLIRRRLGTADAVLQDRAEKEAEVLNREARKLPGTNWDAVQSSPIEVAMPVPGPVGPGCTLLLGAHGRVCIGLPTKDQTGTPAWINAHFHGTISRTGIDLKDNSYNALLFAETVRLHDALIDDLKVDANIDMRRLATLAFERAPGPLADVLYGFGGQSSAAVILSADGRNFETPAEIVLPDEPDLNALLLMMPRAADLEEFGLRLPDFELARRARLIVDTLVGRKPASNEVATILLDRTRQGLSVLERAAQLHRAEGQTFWEPFLFWVVDRFSLEDLAHQLILPIGKDALAKSADRVFLPPSPRHSAESLEDADGEIFEIPEDLTQSLKFLDTAAITVRKTDMWSLTELAGKLAPVTGGLVRSPRMDHLINDAIGPLMQDLGEDEVSERSGIRLLKQAIAWLWTLSESGRERLSKDALRVPVAGTGAYWKWVAPSSTYFGLGWLGDLIGSLLVESYGHNPQRLLVSWETFSRGFDLGHDQRDAWVGALEFLGVSRSPKLIRPRGARVAPLASHSTSELLINSSSCPILQADPFWRAYLETTRRRSANTTSGQKFDYRSIIWIDGLELETSRPALIKLMLLNPSPYESTTSTFLERQNQQNNDAHEVPSLWVHAIRANAWSVIPTQRGAFRVDDAWLLDEHQRGLARRRLALLNQVEEPYAKAEVLLRGIGVTTLQTASVPRLLRAIDQLGKNREGHDAESRRTALTLAEDLFSHFQTAYHKAPVRLPDLKRISLPLERNGEVVGIQGDQISTGYLNDDPVRSDFIPSFHDALIWPLDVRHAYKALVEELRRQLGESAVVFTSRAPVDSRFVEDESLGRANLLEWLSQRFPEHAVASDLACLMAYAGRVPTDPNGDDFRNTWRSFEKASVVFGTFPADAPTPYFYDGISGLLEVAADLSRAETVEATWMLVGPSYRDTWAAYARELDKNNPSKFLTDKRITSANRETVENAIGLSSAERFKHLRAVALVLWLECFGEGPVSVFGEEWKVNARSARGFCRWLGRSDLLDIVASTLGASEELAALAIIRAAGITSEKWQQARITLGMERWTFTHKVKAWHDCMTELISILKTCAARAVSSSLAELEPLLRDARLASPPEDVTSRADGIEDVLGATYRRIATVLDDGRSVAGADLVRRRLSAVMQQGSATLDSVVLDDAPARDVRVYRDEDERKRSRDSRARFDGLMIVTSALAQQLGESFAIEDVSTDPRVVLLLDGWWANSFTVMAAIQRVLQSTVPKSAQRMSDERVFRDPAPANELLGRFKELALAGQDGPPPAPKRRITLLGREQTEDDAAKDLLKGTAGFIGQQLKERASLLVMEPGLGSRIRAIAAVPNARARGRVSRTGGASFRQNRQDRELAGLLGEAFVYEYFRVRLPGFDEMAWRSCSRNAYGLEGDGDDSLGFDFSYRDIENRLAESADQPVCYIEVKSSSGDGSEPFQMTANEWERARECHETAAADYIIVRVAHARDAPKITDVVIDPFGLYRVGQVGVVTREMLVYVGVPQSSSTITGHPSVGL